MPQKTHTNRAIDILEACGWTAGIVERKVSRIVTKDLFGFADVMAINPAWGVVLVQVTSSPNIADRVKKMLQEPRLICCLESGCRVEAWGIRNEPDRHGSLLLARTFVYEDKNLRVCEGSLIVEA